MSATMTTNYLHSDGSRRQLDKLEDTLNNGWYEDREPLTHGTAGNRVQRYFKNDALKTEITIEEVCPTNLFKAPYMFTWVTYISPEGLIYFVTGEEDCLDGRRDLEADDYVSFPNEKALPKDAEFDAFLKALFDGEDHSAEFHSMDKFLGRPAPSPTTMRDVVEDIYGRWCITMKVQTENDAFKLAEFFAKRANLREKVRMVVLE